MPTSTIYAALKAIALNEYPNLVISAQVLALPTGDPLKLRLAIVDGSFRLFPSIFTTATKPPSQQAISATILQKPCANFCRLCATSY